MPNYYDGTKLLSLQDINGNKPEIYICTSNRSAGKTTYFNRLCAKKFIENGEKFALLYRFNYELDNVEEKFFKDIRELFFPNVDMSSKGFGRGIFRELYMDIDGKTKSCGYAMALNNADQIKKYSHFFSDVQRMVFDEFQSETNHYCPDEVTKFISIHTSVARGQGKQVRYVPVYMISNPVSLLNPYYTELGISARLRDDTKFLRGNGFVLEQGFVESASQAQLSSAFNQAFLRNEYIAYSAENIYLNDSMTFVEKLTGKSRYILTLKYKGKSYGVREFPEYGVLYCDNKADESFRIKIAVTTPDHNINYVMLKSCELEIATLRWYFEHGCFRFKNLQCKEALMSAISYF